ncbi:MAG: hypothetical protein AB8B62_06740 [Roseobacter sp.]
MPLDQKFSEHGYIRLSECSYPHHALDKAAPRFVDVLPPSAADRRAEGYEQT